MKKIEIVLIDRESITVTNKDQQIPTTKTCKEKVKKEEIIELFPSNVFLLLNSTKGKSKLKQLNVMIHINIGFVVF